MIRELISAMKRSSRESPMYFSLFIKNAILLKGPIILLVLLSLWKFGAPSEIQYPSAHITLGGIALLQMAEALLSQRNQNIGTMTNPPATIELLLLGGTIFLCFLLVRFTGGIQSKYGLIFLLPILTGATRFRMGGALLVTIICMALYGAFLLGKHNIPDPDDAHEEALELLINMFFSFIIGFLVSLASHQEKTARFQLRKAANEYAAVNAELRGTQKDLQSKLAELEQMEQAIRRADRLAALGEMAAGIAHEIRTPLGVIQSSAEMLGTKVRDIEPKNRLVPVIVEEINRVNGLIKNFLAFANPPVPERKIQALPPILKRMIQLVESTAHSREISVRLRIDDELPPISADSDLLNQCLLNLIMNAIDEMHGGGQLEIGADHRPEREEIAITVRDHGPGISTRNKSHIFNPFFTTKEEGTGLGLAIVQQIVSIHEGRIEAENADGGGALFTIFLPAQVSERINTSGRTAE